MTSMVPQVFRVVRVDHRSHPHVETSHTWHGDASANADAHCVPPCTPENNSTTVAAIAATAAVLVIFGMVAAYSNWWWPYSD